MKNLHDTQSGENITSSSALYNRVRMIIMLTGFTIAVIIALSHSGNVSDHCRAEWKMIAKPINQGDKPAGLAEVNSTGSIGAEALADEQAESNEGNVENSDQTTLRPSLDLDLIFPGMLLSLAH